MLLYPRVPYSFFHCYFSHKDSPINPTCSLSLFSLQTGGNTNQSLITRSCFGKVLESYFFFVLESQLHRNLQYMTTGLECMHIIKYECFSSLQLHWFACLWDKRENLRTRWRKAEPNLRLTPQMRGGKQATGSMKKKKKTFSGMNGDDWCNQI